jgi:hypothetical protein
MSHYLDQPEIYNQPIRLSQQERQHPITVLKKYFHDYHLSDTRHNLWEILSACLSTDTPPYDDPSNRADLLTFYERIEQVLEASFVIATQSENFQG